MPIGAAAGTPQYSGNFIPYYFSKKLLVELFEATCLKEVTNNNYLDELKKGGDAVIVRSTPDVTIRDRAKNGEIIIENINSTPITVSIDHEKYFSFVIDRVDEFQMDIPLQERTAAKAGKDMDIEIEKVIFADIYADVHADNAGLTAGKDGGYDLGVTGTPFVVTKANAYEKTVDCNSCLDDQFAEDMGRFMIAPPPMCNLYQKGDLKDANVYKDGEPIAKNGWIGTMPLTGMKIYKVNTLTSVTDGGYTCYHVLFGQKEGTCFASQIDEVTIGTDVKIRGKVCSGFNDYGYKVVKPELLGDFYCRFVNA